MVHEVNHQRVRMLDSKDAAHRLANVRLWGRHNERGQSRNVQPFRRHGISCNNYLFLFTGFQVSVLHSAQVVPPICTAPRKVAFNNRIIKVGQQRLVVRQNHHLLVGVGLQLVFKDAENEIAARDAVTQLGNHGTEFRISAIVGFKRVKLFVCNIKLNVFHNHAGFRYRFFFVHDFAEEHDEHFGESVLARHGARQAQRVSRGYLHHASAKHFCAHMMTLIKHGQAEVGKHGIGIVFHGKRLQHSNDNVFVVDIDFLSLNPADTCARQKLLNAFEPLVHEKCFVHHHEGLHFQNAHDFQCHNGLTFSGVYIQASAPAFASALNMLDIFVDNCGLVVS